MTKMAAAMDTSWLAASSGQRVHSCIMSHAVFLRNIKSPRWLCPPPPTAQYWYPGTSSFSQNWNHFWKGRDFRPSVKFRKIWPGSLWWLEELCEVLRWLCWRGLGYHCSMYSVSCLLYFLQYVSVFHITCLDTFEQTIHTHVYTYAHTCFWPVFSRSVPYCWLPQPWACLLLG